MSKLTESVFLPKTIVPLVRQKLRFESGALKEENICAWQLSFSPAQFQIRQQFWHTFNKHFGESMNLYDEIRQFLSEFGITLRTGIPLATLTDTVERMRELLLKDEPVLDKETDEAILKSNDVALFERYQSTYHTSAFAVPYAKVMQLGCARRSSRVTKDLESLMRTVYDTATLTELKGDMSENMTDMLWIQQRRLRLAVVEVLTDQLERMQKSMTD